LLFSCLGISKNRLQGQRFGCANELPSGVRKILDEISAKTSEAVFREWMNRLDRCIAALQHCSIAALQHCSIAALQHCTIAVLQHCSKQKVHGMK
jgi:hypothetical protein